MSGKWRWEIIDATTPSGKQLFRCTRCGLEGPTPDKWEYHQAVCLKRKPAPSYPLQVFSLGEESEWFVSKGHQDPHEFFTAACRHGLYEVMERPDYLFGFPTSEWASHVVHGWGRWMLPNMVPWAGYGFDTFLAINDTESGPLAPGPGAFPITYVVTH